MPLLLFGGRGGRGRRGCGGRSSGRGRGGPGRGGGHRGNYPGRGEGAIFVVAHPPAPVVPAASGVRVTHLDYELNPQARAAINAAVATLDDPAAAALVPAQEQQPSVAEEVAAEAEEAAVPIKHRRPHRNANADWNHFVWYLV